MLHKNDSKSHFNVFSTLNNPTPNFESLHLVPFPILASTPTPVERGQACTQASAKPSASRMELAVIASRRCSSFFAEAAVLVLVFGILDFFIQKGSIDLTWIAGALAISLCLLGASIAMDFTAHRWIKAHP